MNLRMARREARMNGRALPAVNTETVNALNALLASVNASLPTASLPFSPSTPAARPKGRPPTVSAPPLVAAPLPTPPPQRAVPAPIKADSPDNSPLSPRMRGAAKAAAAPVAPQVAVPEKPYSGRGRKPGSKNKPKVSREILSDSSRDRSIKEYFESIYIIYTC